MTLSIIIVNYNVKYFLEQCLYSVDKAIKTIIAEVIVVDNNSTDDSVGYLKPKFPQVNFIESRKNNGFGKACNLGVKEASGEYILFLNPDTIVAEDSLESCIRFFRMHPDCGAVGVKMIDGSGAFLKESKRSFPSPQTSLFKLAGLAALFPKSKLFSRYHLGHLSKADNQEVDVLAGAFLMTKKEILDGIGAFDEAFFMYGEDVDLSYRIQKAGYKNYYVAETSIIHFKGESTKRGSLNYVRMFYQAMIIFVRKHYGGAKAGIFSFFIQAAILLRAAVTVFINIIKWIGLPVLDAVLILFSFYLTKEIWVRYIKPDIVYSGNLLLVSFPVLTLVYLVAAYYAGLYDRYFKPGQLLRSTLIATVTVLAVYSLLPEQYRFSRGIVFFGALLSFLFIVMERWLLVSSGILAKQTLASTKPQLLIAATNKEYVEVKNFLSAKGIEKQLIGRVGINGVSDNAIVHINNIDASVKTLGARELLFCAGSLSYKSIIQLTEKHHSSHLKMRYHACGSSSVVGSDASTESGEVLSNETVFNLAHPSYKRAKRLVDVVSSLLLLTVFPIQFFLIKKPLSFFANCFAVLAGAKTWVGYISININYPTIRSGVLTPSGPNHSSANEGSSLIDYWYARNYEPLQDVKTILAYYKYLGG